MRKSNLSNLANELYQFVTQIQKPNLKSASWKRRAKQKSETISSHIQTFRDQLSRKQKNLNRSLTLMNQSMQGYMRELDRDPSVINVKKKYKNMATQYESLRMEIKEYCKEGDFKFDVKRLKTTNYARNLFHMCNGLVGVVLYETILTRTQALTILGTVGVIYLILEVSRRMSKRWNDFLIDKFFGSIARPWERYGVNSATYYLVSVFIITYFCPQHAVTTALIVLAFGDPVASIVGKNLKSPKIYREKTFGGTLGFFAAGFIAALTLNLIVADQLSLWGVFSLAIVASFIGTVTELFTEAINDKLDDNFTIPILVAAVATLWFT